MRRALIAVMLAAISVSGALAAEVPAFVFAAGYHPDSAPVRDIVELGIVHRCGPDWCLRYSRFDSAARL
ncbi:MAG TPA: hypothetical protein VFP68_17435, partial [Burkholderiaceae bacterium]|nr:hypothetical protein [Burkholderiaceae bacterium]